MSGWDLEREAEKPGVESDWPGPEFEGSRHRAAQDRAFQGATVGRVFGHYAIAGLVRYSVLLVMELSTRRVEIAGIVPEPIGEWMKQIARNLTDATDGFLLGANESGDKSPVKRPENLETAQPRAIAPMIAGTLPDPERGIGYCLSRPCQAMFNVCIT